MSYARWGEESDVYVYADASGGVVCCGCPMHVGVEEHDWTDFFGIKHVKGERKMFGDTLHFYSADDLIAHLQEHVDAGGTIPPDLLDPATYAETGFDPFERNPSSG